MDEKLYKTVKSAGAGGIALGVCVLVTGIVCGVLMVVNGSRLLAQKSKVLL